MTKTMIYTGVLVVKTCWCGLGFAFPQALYNEHLKVGTHIKCPLGHGVQWTGRGSLLDDANAESERQRKRAERLAAQLTHKADQLEATERSRAAFKGQLTRLRKRIANGVCPWCDRHFENVMRHVATKHPQHIEKAREAKAS